MMLETACRNTSLLNIIQKTEHYEISLGSGQLFVEEVTRRLAYSKLKIESDIR